MKRGSLLILRPPLVYGPGEKGSFYGPMGFVRAAMKETNPFMGDGDELREFYSLMISQQWFRNCFSRESNNVVNVVSGQSHDFMTIVNSINL